MSNIAISDLQTQAESLDDKDLLLISKSSEDNSTYTSAKIKASCLIDLIDSKIQTLANSLSNLREVVSDVTNEIVSNPEDIISLNYCTLDGNLGVYGPDIPNYDNIDKWEIKFQLSDYNSKTSTRYLWDATASTGYTQWLVYLGNNKVYYIEKSIVEETPTYKTLYRNKVVYDGNDHVFIVSYSTGIFSIDDLNVTYNRTSSKQRYDQFPDYLLTRDTFDKGLIGKLYYIKGYNTSNELIANLTPRSRLNYVYLHDGVTDTSVNFRGSGSALAPAS